MSIRYIYIVWRFIMNENGLISISYNHVYYNMYKNIRCTEKRIMYTWFLMHYTVWVRDDLAWILFCLLAHYYGYKTLSACPSVAQCKTCTILVSIILAMLYPSFATVRSYLAWPNGSMLLAFSQGNTIVTINSYCCHLHFLRFESVFRVKTNKNVS